MRREPVQAAVIAVIATLALAGLIVVGSRRLSHFDAALVGYTFASLFAAFAITYRYAMWLQRPPTAVYWRRGWQLAFQPRYFLHNAGLLARRFAGVFLVNIFIWRRDPWRGLAHWLIMWGCITAALITFPLVFGWIHFESVPEDLAHYRVVLFGFGTISFPTESLFGMVLFHGLVWSSLLVIPGVMLAMRRRMRERDAAVLQTFGDDFLPLVLLFAVSITGLMLTVSYEWMHGYAYDFLALLHAVTVIFTLLWLPFGKFFHIFQRPAQLGVAFYKDVGQRSEPALCARCGDHFASQMHVHDLIEVERRLGYRYELPDEPAGHYQWICPRCRRTMAALAQGRLWQGSKS
jgi:hypothetical protein